MLKLYSYFRSSASYRVRIALALKGVKAEIMPIDLLAGEQREAAYAKINPQQLVPALADEHGRVITQSLAIIEYLEERYPTPPLLPDNPFERARVRALALAVACDIGPLNNSGVLQYLTGVIGASDSAKNQWYAHWIVRGLAALERLLAESPCTGRFCHGDTPGLADCALVPQVFNARRYQCDLDGFPTVVRIADACNALPAFIAASPQHSS